MLTSPVSNVISRAIMPLSSRLSSSFTRSNRCFICSGPALSGRLFYSARRPRKRSGWLHCSQFLRHLLKLVTLDDVAHLVFGKISQLDAAFEAGPNFLHIVLEAAQSSHAPIVDRLAAA